MLARRIVSGVKRGVSVPAWAIIDGIKPIICYQPKGAASLADSYINLADPGNYDATAISPPSFTVDGWTSGGSAAISTGFTPIDGMTMIMRAVGISAANGALSLVRKLGNRDVRLGHIRSSSDYYAIGDAAAYPAASVNDGIFGFAVGAGSAHILSLYGSSSYIGSYGQLPTDQPIPLMCELSELGGHINSINATVCAAAIYDTKLTLVQLLSLKTAMEAI